jgi:hypothetical protein
MVLVHYGSSQAEVGDRVPFYKMRGNGEVTENVTWLSPVTCDPVKSATG